MARKVYYGISTSLSTAQEKIVEVRDVSLIPSELMPGDILGVYFSQRNDAEGPVTLRLSNVDPNADVSAQGDLGHEAHNTGTIAIGPCDWTNGEVVFFTYVKNIDADGFETNVAHWEMVAKVHARNDVYGDVLLEDIQLIYEVNGELVDGWDANNDDAAATIGLIKKHIPPEWLYKSLFGPYAIPTPRNNDEKVGYFYILDESEQTGEKIKAEIYVPAIPTNVSAFENDAGYLSNPITTNLIFNGADSEGEKTLDKQEEGGNSIVVIDLDHDPTSPLSGNEDGAVGINGDTYIYGNLNIVADNRINVGEIHAYPEDGGVIDVTSPINIGDTIHLNGDTYIGDKPLDDYIKDLFADDDTGVQSMINDSLADALADYMFTKRYYASIPNQVPQGAIVMVAYGDNPTEDRDDVIATYYNSESLHVPGYDIVAATTWETWQDGTKSNPKNANMFGIWWQGNDPQSEVLYFKVAAIDAPIEKCNTSVDILYKKSAYTINYDAMGGTGAPNPQHKLYNQTIQLSDIVPVKPGTNFKGWRTDPNSGKIAYQPNDLYSANATCTLYAFWSDSGNTLLYDLQGIGRMIKTMQTMLYEEAVYAAKIPTLKIGSDMHQFSEWNTDPQGNGIAYKSGGLIKEANEPPFDLTLYAIWDKKVLTYGEYTVWTPISGANPQALGLYEQHPLYRHTYVLTTDTRVQQRKTYYEGNVATAYMTYPFETRAASDILEKENKMIAAWSTEENGQGTIYSVGQVIKEANAFPPGTMTLFPIWDNQLKLIYHSNIPGQTDETVEIIMNYKDEAIVNCNSFEYSGYVVDHWCIDPNDSEEAEERYAFGDVIKGANVLPTTDIHLYAIWNEPTVLTYYSNTSSEESVVIPLNYADEEDAASAIFENEGYVLDHWNTAADDSGISYAIGQTIKSEREMQVEDIELYAIWNIPQTVTYNSYTPYNTSRTSNPHDLGLYEYDNENHIYFLTSDNIVDRTKIYYKKETPKVVELNYAGKEVAPSAFYLKIKSNYQLTSWKGTNDLDEDVTFLVGATIKEANTMPSNSYELEAQWSSVSNNAGRI